VYFSRMESLHRLRRGNMIINTLSTISKKSTHKVGISLLLCLFTFTSQAANLTSFKKRFEFVRNDSGEVEYVRDRSITMNFSLRPYLQFIKESLQTEQALMKQKGDYDSQISNLFNQNEQTFIGEANKNGTGQSQIVVDSLRALENVDFDEVFAHPKFVDLMGRYEQRLGDALIKLDPTVLAHLKDQDFFYQKRVTYQVLTWGLNFAKKRMSQLPILNTASYVLVKVEELIRQRRMFHQNLLMHYLEKVSESELGLKKIEVDHIMSSVYESRIDWFAFWESRTAKAQWDKYGFNKFYGDVRFNNSRFRGVRGLYTNVGGRLNYGFQEVTLDNERVILNLFHNEHMFSRNLAVAYNLDKPQAVARKRMVIQLAELGLSFVPLPSFIKGFAEDFMSSFHKEQSLVEGGLYGYFEANGRNEEMNQIKLQILNPFETL
jgi:hypothetical protein